MKFMSVSQFEKRHPKLMGVIRDNRHNDFCQSIFEQIKSGKNITKKQLAALEQFLPARVELKKHDLPALPVTITGVTEKGWKFTSKDLRLRGRFEFDSGYIAEEVFDRRTIEAVENTTRPKIEAIVGGEVQWVLPDKDFIIVRPEWAKVSPTKAEWRDAVEKVKDDPTSSGATESWSRAPSAAASTKTSTTEEDVKVSGVYYARRCVYKSSKNNKFWAVIVEKVHTRGHDPTFRVVRHWGKIGSRGKTDTNAFDGVAEAIRFAVEKYKDKIEKGYGSGGSWPSVGDYSNELDDDAEIRRSAKRCFFRGHYDIGKKRVVFKEDYEPDDGLLADEPLPAVEVEVEVEPVIIPENERQSLLPQLADWKSAF